MSLRYLLLIFLLYINSTTNLISAQCNFPLQYRTIAARSNTLKTFVIDGIKNNINVVVDNSLTSSDKTVIDLIHNIPQDKINEWIIGLNTDNTVLQFTWLGQFNTVSSTNPGKAFSVNIITTLITATTILLLLNSNNRDTKVSSLVTLVILGCIGGYLLISIPVSVESDEVVTRNSCASITPLTMKPGAQASTGIGPLSSSCLFLNATIRVPNADVFNDFQLMASQTSLTLENGISNTQRWSNLFPLYGPIALQEGCSVLIPSGMTVIYDVNSSVPLKYVIVEGTLEFDADKNALLTAHTVEVRVGGTLRIKPANANIQHIMEFNGILEPHHDPELIRLGLLGYGEIDVQGSKVVSTLFRQVDNAIAGTNQIIMKSALDTNMDWERGDELLISSDRKYVYSVNSMYEKVKVVSVSGSIITVESPLLYDHNYMNSGYVMHLSRNVIFRNTGGFGIANQRQGHIFFNGQANVNFRYALMENLGRTTMKNADSTKYDSSGNVIYQATNPKGRYALHCHFCLNAFNFEGNVVYNSSRWGIVNHMSYGSITKNIVIGAPGAGISGEDGGETGSVTYNFVYGFGGGTHFGDGIDPNGNRNTFDTAGGTCGSAYWTRSPYLTWRYNWAAGRYECEAYNFAMFTEFIKMPSIPGMPLTLFGTTQRPHEAALYPVEHNVADAEITWNEFPCAIRLWGGHARSSHYSFIISNFTSYKNGVGTQGYASGIEVYNSTFINIPGRVIVPYKYFYMADGQSLFIMNNTFVKGYEVGIRVHDRKELMFINNCKLENKVEFDFAFLGIHWEGRQWSGLVKVVNTKLQGTISVNAFDMFDIDKWTGPVFGADPTHQMKFVWTSYLLQSMRRIEFYNFNLTGEDFALALPQQAADWIIPAQKLNYHTSDLTNYESLQIYGRVINDYIVYPPFRTHPNFNSGDTIPYLTSIKRRRSWHQKGIYTFPPDNWMIVKCTNTGMCPEKQLQYHLDCPLESRCGLHEGCEGCERLYKIIPQGQLKLGWNKIPQLLNATDKNVPEIFTHLVWGYYDGATSDTGYNY